ncbi:TPA: hypothetical protein ACGF3M_001672 [Vibrio cholerae]|nr:hypothetical protein [Vibrio cholerae]
MPHARYPDLSELERQDIRQTCAAEQFYLCAYCCQAISGSSGDTMNEHVEAQKLAPNRTLDFTNLVASCRTPNQCDAAHGSQPLPLTPLMLECETELRFKLSGRVEGLSESAREAISVLNLGDTEQNNKALIEKRKQLIDGLIWANYGDDPVQLQLEEDEDLIRMLLDDLARPKNGRLEPFAPVLSNILRGRLAA